MARTFHAACQSQDSLRFGYLFTIAFVQCCLLSDADRERKGEDVRDAFKVHSWWEFISFSFFFVSHVHSVLSAVLSTALFSLDSILFCSRIFVFYCHHCRSSFVDGRQMCLTAQSFVQFKINFAKHITFICYVHYTIHTHKRTTIISTLSSHKAVTCSPKRLLRHTL